MAKWQKNGSGYGIFFAYTVCHFITNSPMLSVYRRFSYAVLDK